MGPVGAGCTRTPAYSESVSGRGEWHGQIYLVVGREYMLRVSIIRTALLSLICIHTHTHMHTHTHTHTYTNTLLHGYTATILLHSYVAIMYNNRYIVLWRLWHTSVHACRMQGVSTCVIHDMIHCIVRLTKGSALLHLSYSTGTMY